MEMKFIVYRSDNKTKKELRNDDLCLGHQGIPNSKIDMQFHKTEAEVQNEEGETVLEKGNIQVYIDERRNLIFAELTPLSKDTHEKLFGNKEVLGELLIPGKKEATERFVKRMLKLIRAYKPIKKEETKEIDESNNEA